MSDEVIEEARRAGQEQALFTQQELQQAAAQAHQYGEQMELQQYGAEFLRKNPDMAQQFDLFATEVQSLPHDPVDDPTHMKRFERAAQAVRNGIKRADQKWHREQEAQFGKGLALNPWTGQLIESAPGPDVPVEEETKTGNSFVDGHRAKRAKLKQTYSNLGES